MYKYVLLSSIISLLRLIVGTIDTTEVIRAIHVTINIAAIPIIKKPLIATGLNNIFPATFVAIAIFFAARAVFFAATKVFLSAFFAFLVFLLKTNVVFLLFLN